jgi:hypothetical protein
MAGKNKKQCLKCLVEKEPTKNFYKSFSHWHGDGLLPLCKGCLKSFLGENEDKLHIPREIMRVLDKPFKKDTWIQAMELKKDTLGEYFRLINLNNKTENYDNSILEKTRKVDNGDFEEEVQPSGDVFINETKVYSKSWLGYYTPSEIEYLEEYFKGLDRDFRIATSSHKDYAKKIAKASLHMDKCFQEMQDGVNGADKKYKEAKDIFDTLSKSAKFSESQRGITDVGMGSISQIVEMVESETYVYEHKNDLDKDMYDKLIDDFKHIYKSL